MILALDTSSPTCKLWLISDDNERYVEWEAGRQLADGILNFLRASLAEQGQTWGEITGLIAYRGPGSFTGLRIGLTVLNTLASDRSLPIVGESGDQWLQKGKKRLALGSNDHLVMPLYGREPNITTPRK